MAADPRARDDQPAATAEPQDLIGRWLAHHEQRSDPAPDAPGAVEVATVAADVAPVVAAAPGKRAARRLPTAAVPSAALAGDPVLGSVLSGGTVAPSGPGARRRAPDRGVDEIDRQPPPGWEPVLLGSVRKKTAKADERSAVTPVERPGRLSRLRSRLVEPEAQPEPEPEPEADLSTEPEPEPEVVVAEPEPARTAPATPVAKEEMAAVYVFRRRRGARRVLTVVLLAGLAGSAYAVREAYEVREGFTLAIAAIVVAATVVVWAIRAGASLTTLTVRGGQLEVLRQGARHVFDLTSPYTRVEVRGRAGRRGWKVVLPRRGMPPLVVDSSLVDPKDFMRVLRHHRPDLADRG